MKSISIHSASSRAAHPSFALCTLACLLLAGCGGADEGPVAEPAGPTEPRIETTLTSGLTPDDPSATAFGAAEGDVKLAEVSLGATHSVVFWQDASGVVTVIESFDADENPDGSALTGFDAHRDPYGDLYERLAKEHLDVEVLARLQTIDADREDAGRLVRGDGAAPIEELDDVGLVTKTVAGDREWFLNDYCTLRTRTNSEDARLCLLDTLTPNPRYWTITSNPGGYERSNIAFFNATQVGTGRLTTTGFDCGFLEAGLCSGLRTRVMDVPPRWVSIQTNSSDSGFNTTAKGMAFGVHYMYWN